MQIFVHEKVVQFSGVKSIYHRKLCAKKEVLYGSKTIEGVAKLHLEMTMLRQIIAEQKEQIAVLL